MEFIASLIARIAGRSPLATRVASKLARDPFRLLQGKPLERQLLVYDLPGSKLALANDPEIVDAVLLNRSGTFPKSAILTALLEPLIGSGVFGQGGGEHVRAARRMFIQATAQVGDATVDETARRLTAEYIDAWVGSRQPVPVCSELSRLTVDIVSLATLGGRFDDRESRRFVDLFFEYHRRASPVALLIAGGGKEQQETIVRQLGLEEVGVAMRRLVEQRFMEPIIKGDEAALAAPFAVAMRDAGMLGSTPGDLAANPRRRDAAIDQIAVMLLAGHETTASALSWLIWELAEQPERQEAAAAVFRGERPTGGPVSPWRGADPSALADALARESLRLYPPIAFLLRQTASDVVFRGKSVPAGNQFAIAPWTLHRHRRYWPRPDAFEPERWLAAGPLPKEARYIPFGKGARVCPGEKFAWVEMRAIIPTLLSRARLRLLDGRRPKPLGALTSRPNRDFPVSLELRPTL